MTSDFPSASIGRAYAEVIGDPISHSMSPAIHCFWLDQLGIDATYGRAQVGRAQLAEYLATTRADPDWRGSNVTMPLKLDAAALADEVTDPAAAAGAANVLIPRDGKVVAANTDVGAIATLLNRLRQGGSAMNDVTLLGNGGAARAALVAFKTIGLSAVRIQARDHGEAMRLAVEFGLEWEPVALESPISGDGLVNATPLGMTGREPLDPDLARISANGWVFDMVTEPEETLLIAAARELGLSAVTGLEMLVEQAAASFQLLFDAEPPRDRDEQLWQMLRP